MPSKQRRLVGSMFGQIWPTAGTSGVISDKKAQILKILSGQKWVVSGNFGIKHLWGLSGVLWNVITLDPADARVSESIMLFILDLDELTSGCLFSLEAFIKSNGMRWLIYSYLKVNWNVHFYNWVFNRMLKHWRRVTWQAIYIRVASPHLVCNHLWQSAVRRVAEFWQTYLGRTRVHSSSLHSVQCTAYWRWSSRIKKVRFAMSFNSCNLL